MSDRAVESDLIRAAIAEGIGTAMLALVGPGAAMVAASTHAFGAVGVALAFGLVVAILVATFGSISGAHVNPAVTIALWSAGRFPRRAVLPYVTAQCAGAVVGALALRWLLGPVGNFGATIPTLDLPRSFAVETGYSGILALVILAVATDGRVPRSVPPLIIGATVFAGALVAGPLTGGSFNPARSLGPAVAGAGWTAQWLYWFAPITGMLVAVQAYAFLRGSKGSSLVEHGEPLRLEGSIPLLEE